MKRSRISCKNAKTT